MNDQHAAIRNEPSQDIDMSSIIRPLTDSYGVPLQFSGGVTPSDNYGAPLSDVTSAFDSSPLGTASSSNQEIAQQDPNKNISNTDR